MQTACLANSPRYITSVSDLLRSTDEIERLLDADLQELKTIEAAQYLSDSDDRATVNSMMAANHSLGNDPTTACAANHSSPDSPVGQSVHSWDSHVHCRPNPNNLDSSALSLYSGVLIYCDYRHFVTPTGFFRLLFLITSFVCLICLCTAGTAKVGLFMLPHASRVRFALFVVIVGLLCSIVLLFLDLTHTRWLFPFNWARVNAYFYTGLSLLFLIAASLIFHTIFLSEAFSWVPKWTVHQLLISGCLGYVCCLETAIIAFIQQWSLSDDQQQRYQSVSQEPILMNLHPMEMDDQLKQQYTNKHHGNTMEDGYLDCRPANDSAEAHASYCGNNGQPIRCHGRHSNMNDYSSEQPCTSKCAL